jgi:hypothetical protein
MDAIFKLVMHEEESEIWHKEGFLYTHIYTRKRHTMKKRD